MYPYLQQVTDDADGVPVTGPVSYFSQKDTVALKMFMTYKVVPLILS